MDVRETDEAFATDFRTLADRATADLAFAWSIRATRDPRRHAAALAAAGIAIAVAGAAIGAVASRPENRSPAGIGAPSASALPGGFRWFDTTPLPTPPPTLPRPSVPLPTVSTAAAPIAPGPISAGVTSLLLPYLPPGTTVRSRKDFAQHGEAEVWFYLGSGGSLRVYRQILTAPVKVRALTRGMAATPERLPGGFESLVLGAKDGQGSADVVTPDGTMLSAELLPSGGRSSALTPDDVAAILEGAMGALSSTTIPSAPGVSSS